MQEVLAEAPSREEVARWFYGVPGACVVQFGHTIERSPIMSTTVPIRDLKNTSEFAQLVLSSNEPIRVTRNDEEIFVVLKSDDYKKIQDTLCEGELIHGLWEAECDIRMGRTRPAVEAIEEISASYGI